MAQYILESNKFTAITETEGTLVNISNVPAEVSLSEEFGTGIILFPHQQLAFAKAVYAARAPGSYGRAIVAAIGTGGLQAETFTQEDIDAVFDDEGGGYIPPSGDDETFTQADIDAIFADNTVDYEGFTQDDVAEVFTGGYKPKPHKHEHFTPEDVDYVFDESHKHHKHHKAHKQEHFTPKDVDYIFDESHEHHKHFDEKFTDDDIAEIFAA